MLLNWAPLLAPPRSRYLRLSFAEGQYLGTRFRLRKLAVTSQGELYLNLER